MSKKPATTSFGEKPKGKSLKGKLTSAFKKATMWTIGLGVLGSAVGGTVWYNYGTVETKEVNINSRQYLDARFYDKGLVTSGGTYSNVESFFHGKSSEDIAEVKNSLSGAGVYRVESYGVNFSLPFKGDLQKNVLSIEKVSQEELDARAAAEAEAAAAEAAAQAEAEAEASATPAATATPEATSTTPAQQQPALSGEMTTVTFIVNGYRVNITMPVEAADQVSINSVRPVNNTPANNLAP